MLALPREAGKGYSQKSRQERSASILEKIAKLRESEQVGEVEVRRRIVRCQGRGLRRRRRGSGSDVLSLNLEVVVK